MNLVADAARVPWGTRLANAAVSYIAYLGHVLWPQGLAVYYPFPRSIPLWKTGVCVVVLLLITGAVCRSARRFPWMAVGWLWFVGTLVPVIGLVQGGLWPRMADRWAYVPMIGIVIVVVFGVEALVRRFRVPVYGAGTLALAVLATLSLASCRQVGYWENSITLFQRALAVTEGSALAHDNLGLALALRGRYADAQGHFQEALRLNPGYHKSYHNQGAIYLLKGDLPQAWRYLSKALELNPQSERVHNNLGQICLQWGAVDCAIGHFQAALQLNPGYSSARKNLQQALQLREPGAEGRTAVTKP
jgi:Flp pilus assembly protein TadD